jgi:hypothetical protein
MDIHAKLWYAPGMARERVMRVSLHVGLSIEAMERLERRAGMVGMTRTAFLEDLILCGKIMPVDATFKTLDPATTHLSPADLAGQVEASERNREALKEVLAHPIDAAEAAGKFEQAEPFHRTETAAFRDHGAQVEARLVELRASPEYQQNEADFAAERAARAQRKTERKGRISMREARQIAIQTGVNAQRDLDSERALEAEPLTSTLDAVAPSPGSQTGKASVETFTQPFPGSFPKPPRGKK